MRRRRNNTPSGKASAPPLALLLLLAAAALQTTTAFLLPSVPSDTANASGILSRRQPSQQAVAPLEASKRGGGGKGYGSSGGGGASAGPTAVGGGSLRGFTKVLAEGGELAAAANSQKAVGPFSFGGEEKFLLLVRRQGGAISALDTNCGRCKFPLLNGRVLKDESEEMKDEEDKEVIACPLCAVTHSLADGRVTGAQASGMLQKVSASFFAKQVATGVKAYDAVAGSDGAVYVKLR